VAATAAQAGQDSSLYNAAFDGNLARVKALIVAGPM